MTGAVGFWSENEKKHFEYISQVYLQTEIRALYLDFNIFE